jgi:hypothetical protein
VYCIEDAARVAKDIIVPKPQHNNSSFAQKRITTFIVIAFGVLRTICLDNPPPFKADEINDVWRDDDLPFEFEDGHPLVAEH